MAISLADTYANATADALLNKLEQRIGNLQIGDGMKEGAELGPLVTKTHLERVTGYLQHGKEEGAELVVDGRDSALPKGEGFFLEACLFDHVKPEMKIYREEVYGPVVGAVRVNNFETALHMINDNEYANR